MQDDTARRLFDAGASRVEPALPALPALPPVSTMAPRAELSPAPVEHSAADAEQALRGLEAEWAMRMEAPLSALANLEESVSLSIEHAHASLPQALRAAAMAEEIER